MIASQILIRVSSRSFRLHLLFPVKNPTCLTARISVPLIGSSNCNPFLPHTSSYNALAINKNEKKKKESLVKIITMKISSQITQTKRKNKILKMGAQNSALVGKKKNYTAIAAGLEPLNPLNNIYTGRYHNHTWTLISTLSAVMPKIHKGKRGDIWDSI